MAEASADPAIRRYNGSHDRLGRPSPALSATDAEARIDRFALNWRAFASTGTPSGVAFAILEQLVSSGRRPRAYPRIVVVAMLVVVVVAMLVVVVRWRFENGFGPIDEYSEIAVLTSGQ